MTDHLKTLRELVAAGEKASPAPWWIGTRADGWPEGSICGRDVLDTAALKSRYEVQDAPRVCNLGGFNRYIKQDANQTFAVLAANARPALAALLRVVEAASKRLNQLDPLRAVIEIAERDGHLKALNPEVLARRLISEFEQQDALRAALRDLAPEAEDGE